MERRCTYDQISLVDDSRTPGRFYFGANAEYDQESSFDDALGDGVGSHNSSVVSSSSSSDLGLIEEHEVASSLDGFGIETSMIYTSSDEGSDIRISRVVADRRKSHFLNRESLDESNRSIVTEESSIFSSADLYFERQLSEGDQYIFADDDGSPAHQRLTESESVLLNSSFASAFSSKDQPSSASMSVIKSPNTWATLNQQRGRLLARSLLRQARRRELSPGSVSTMEEEYSLDEERDDVPPEDTTTISTIVTKRRRHGRRKPSSRLFFDQRQSLLTRAVQSMRRQRQKVFAHSTSPLDNLCHDSRFVGSLPATTPNNITSTTMLSPVPSAVHARNALADFGSWEKAAIAASPTGFRHLENHKSQLECIPEHEYASDSTDEKWSIERLSAPDFSTRSNVTSGPKSCPIYLGLSLFDGLEGRASAQDVALMLGLGQDGERLLRLLHGKAGIVDVDDDEDDCYDDESMDGGCATIGSSGRGVPLIHLLDDFWLPHYEEYVTRTVNSFSRLFDR